jgi:hypothetical protein
LVNQTLQIMKSRFLFPHKWRIAGTIIVLLGILIALYQKHDSGGLSAETELNGGFFNASKTQKINVISNDVEYLSFIIGLLLVGFSKEKVEDEQIVQLRLDSLQWAMYINFGILIVCTILINGTNFLAVIDYNVISPLIFFIIRFRWKVFLLNRQLKAEENQALNHV